jgi:hypothetical protein
MTTHANPTAPSSSYGLPNKLCASYNTFLSAGSNCRRCFETMTLVAMRRARRFASAKAEEAAVDKGELDVDFFSDKRIRKFYTLADARTHHNLIMRSGP